MAARKKIAHDENTRKKIQASKGKQAKWYVYELVDPMDLNVFYVGKGKGNRINHHEREAKTGKYSNLSKVEKIRAIWGAGMSVVKNKVACFWDEQAAYDCEHERILSHPNLTNIKKNPQTISSVGSLRVISFFKLLRKIFTGRRAGNIDIVRLKVLFPRELLPTDEHKELYDLAVKYGSRA